MHVLLTGASSGIGAALARHLGVQRADVTLVARRADRLQAVAAEIQAAGGRAQVLARDLCDLDAVSALPAEAEAGLGPIDVLINNAGLDLVESYPRSALDVAERVVLLNLTVPLRLTRLVLPGMLERRCGTIVDIASIAAFTTQPFGTHYSAAKAGLANAGRQLRWELRGSGVQVITVYPGPIPTDMGNYATAAYKGDWGTGPLPQGTTDGMARRILSAIDQGTAEVVYPPIYSVVKWFPWLMDLAMPWIKLELSELR